MAPDLKVRIELEALTAELEGMRAENMQRYHCGNSMAYRGDAFDTIAARMRELVAPDHAPITVSPCNCEQALRLQEQLDGSRALLAATKSALEDALKARSDWESAAASACRERDAANKRLHTTQADHWLVDEIPQ